MPRKTAIKMPPRSEMDALRGVTSPATSNGNGKSKGIADLPDWFNESLVEVRSGIPILDESVYTERLEAIRGQIRAVKIAQENLRLNNELVVAEGIYLDGINLGVENDIRREKINTTGVKLQQQQARTAIERGKLLELQADVEGHMQQAQIKAQSWNIKLESLKSDLAASAQTLANKREELRRSIAGFDPTATLPPSR